MICNEIILGSRSILKVYHKDFTEASNRKVLHDRKIGRYNLKFCQYQVSNKELEKITGFAYKREGLLEPNVCPNPYGERVCTIMTHYVFDEKPSNIFGTTEDSYFLKITIQEFIEIAEFAEKYTGIDIKKAPMIFGDVFVFSFCNIDIKATEYNGIIVSNIPADATNIAVYFKNFDLIVHSELISIPIDASTIDISCKEKWTNHDIYIYSNKNLIYSRKNVSYMRSFNIKTRVSTEKEIPLNTIGNKYRISEYSSQSLSSSTKSIETSLALIYEANKKIINLIENENTDSQVVFIKPGEMDKALDIIGKIMESGKDDLWIFDSYFTDRNEFAKSLDWLRIISICKSNNKNIVFFTNNSGNCMNAGDLQNEIANDSYLQDIIRINGKLGVTFYQTKSPIHDRFILVQNESSYFGLIMGTSFNSLERNHYCLSNLAGNSAKRILTELKDWLNAGNIINRLEV